MPGGDKAIERLTDFLTGDGDEHIDMNTEFPSGKAVRVQEMDRLLDEEFGMKPFGRRADRRARIMWSYKRKSREEAVRSMGVEEEEEARFANQDQVDLEEE